MNLFCFSLEGSTDSVYEVVKNSGETHVYSFPSRSSSSTDFLNHSTQCTRATSGDISQINSSFSKKKKQRQLPNFISDSNALVRSMKQADFCTKKEKPHHVISTEREKQLPVQTVMSQTEVGGGPGIMKRMQKSHHGRHETQTSATTHAHSQSMGPVGHGHAIPLFQENSSLSMRHRQIHDHWSNPLDYLQVWTPNQHICCRLPTECHAHTQEFTLKSTADGQSWNKVSSSLGMVRSMTSMDFRATDRATSFGKFESFMHPRLEEDGTTLAEGESGVQRKDKQHSLGKKMKAIALTMRRGKKPIKSCSEDVGDDTDREPEGGTESRSQLGKTPNHSNDSLESLSIGQSSSSAMTSSSDTSGNRDSLRLDEDASYTGPFCGRARVHTDFVPSPYDTDLLKLKVGDIINIISKPPMGIWTGILNNKVGNFKFIYVEVLLEKEKDEEKEEKEDEEDALKIRPQRLSKRPRPKTLLELLERLHLEEYASTLLLNGYQSVDDLKHLKDQHLIELNVTDPEHRRKLLAASEVIYDMGRGELDEDETKGEEDDEDKDDDDEEASDCPRDSGCFIPKECPDASREDSDIH